MTHRTFLFLALPLLWACPPKARLDDTGPQDGGGTDGGGTDGGGSDGGADGGGDGGAAQSIAVMTTLSMDFATGGLATVALDDWAVADNLATTTGDTALVVDDGWVLQINRFGYDTVRLYRPGSWSAPALEISVGGESPTNPQDARLCADRLFVSLFETTGLPWYDPGTGILSGEVDLSGHADIDGLPEVSSMVERDGKLYVALQRLDRSDKWVWTDSGSEVVEIDCATGTETGAWAIGGNAAVHDWPGGDGVLVSARAFGKDLAGLYRLDPEAGTRTLLVEVGGGGDTLSGVAPFGDKAVITTLAADYSSYGIACADLGTGALVPAESVLEFLGGAAVNDRGEAWISAHWGWIDPGEAVPGLIVYDIATCSSLTAGDPVSLDLAPAAVGFY